MADFGGTLFAAAISVAVALVSSVATFIVTVLIGSTLYHGEAGYGFGLLFAFPAALLVGLITMVLTFRKLK
jgi:hypothetical protein